MTALHYYAPTAFGIWSRQWDIGCSKELGIEGWFEILSEEERKVGL